LFKVGDLFRLSFPAFSFKPLTDVVFQLHSDVKQLGGATAADDGSLTVDVVSNDFQPGQHSLHAIGQNYAGNQIEYYDFLQVAAGDSKAEADQGLNVPAGSMTSIPPASSTLTDSKQKLAASSLVQRLDGTSSSSAQSTDRPLEVASSLKLSASTTKQPVDKAKSKSANSSALNAWIIVISALASAALAILLYSYYHKKRQRNAAR
jgi:hypothetical protein